MTAGPTRAGNELRAVLFDMDGTLVDTEPYWIAAENALVDEFGGTWTDADAHALVGNDLLVSAAYLRDVGGVDLDPAVIVDRMLDSVIAAAQREMPWRPGALGLLHHCRAAGLPCALVTMSYTRLAATLVDRLPADTFATVVTGDQVGAGKPHPEAYLTACRRLGVRPACAVAIEDSPTGVASAEAAGCAVLAVPHRVRVAPAPTRTLVDSLESVTVAQLAALVS